MTNREKFKEVYGFEPDCRAHCNPLPCLEKDCQWYKECGERPGTPCRDWWEMEFKERTDAKESEEKQS